MEVPLPHVRVTCIAALEHSEKHILIHVCGKCAVIVQRMADSKDGVRA